MNLCSLHVYAVKMWKQQQHDNTNEQKMSVDSLSEREVCQNAFVAAELRPGPAERAYITRNGGATAGRARSTG